MTETQQQSDALAESLVAQVQAMREAERRLFGALDPDVRDASLRPGDWSPKDHQAHLTAWKARQAERIRTTRMGEPFPSDDRETDEINAELQKLRADWAWDAIVTEADAVSQKLEDEIAAAGGQMLRDSDRLVGGIFGNGPFHAAIHFGWLLEAGIGVDAEAVWDFLDEEERQLASTDVPNADRGSGIYNLACAQAIVGRLDRARELLPSAFRLRPDLAEFAKDDPDLVRLRDELEELAAVAAS